MRRARLASSRPHVWLILAAALLFMLAGPVAAARAADEIPIETRLVDDDGTLIELVDDPPPVDENTPPDEVISDGPSGVSEEAAPEPAPEYGGSTDAAAPADDGAPIETRLVDDDGTLIEPVDDPPPIDENTPPDEVISDGLSGVSEEAVPEPAPEYGGSADYAAAVAAVGPLPSCRAFTVRGTYGFIAVQTSPVGYLQWGSQMYRGSDNNGWWGVWVFVNGRLVDKKSQWYSPHGSLPPSMAPSGSVFAVNIAHTFIRWRWWPPGFSVIGVIGNLTCIVP